MIDLGPHAGFILWSYAGVALVMAAVIAATVLQARATKAQLARLEAEAGRGRAEPRG